MPTPACRGVGRPREPIPRRHLLSAARAEFAAAGFAGASMRQVAERAGVRKASMFYHFGSKDALYGEVLDEVVTELRGYVTGALDGEGHFIERLDRLGERVVHYLGSHPGAARLLVREMVDRGGYASGDGRPAIAATFARTTEFLEAGMAAGVFRACDARQLTLSVVGLHLFYFAAAEEAFDVTGADVYSAEQLAVRAREVLAQVRALVVGPPADPQAPGGYGPVGATSR